MNKSRSFIEKFKIRTQRLRNTERKQMEEYKDFMRQMKDSKKRADKS